MTSNVAPIGEAGLRDGSIASDPAIARLDAARARSVEDWQRRTLPFVQWGIFALALLVFVSVIVGGWTILNGVEEGSHETSQYSSAIESSLKAESFEPNKTTLGIIAYQSARQHDRAGAALLTRELLRFCGFLIGAALSFVGAIFVMGKFADVQPNKADVERSGLKASLVTSSPGIFAMTVGAILVGVSIFAHYEIGVTDARLHLIVPGAASDSFDPLISVNTPPSTEAGKQAVANLCEAFPGGPNCP